MGGVLFLGTLIRWFRNESPLQGLIWMGRLTQRVALGWYEAGRWP